MTEQFIVQVQCIEGSPVEKLIGAILTTDYKFEFDSLDGIEAAYKLALNHRSQHPEVICCNECSKPAEFVRRTQFAGNHYFCADHAKQEEDFGTKGESFRWESFQG